eukprot:2370199-Pleurochrysis_carterae.AAC.1
MNCSCRVLPRSHDLHRTCQHLSRVLPTSPVVRVSTPAPLLRLRPVRLRLFALHLFSRRFPSSFARTSFPFITTPRPPSPPPHFPPSLGAGGPSSASTASRRNTRTSSSPTRSVGCRSSASPTSPSDSGHTRRAIAATLKPPTLPPS